MNLNLPLTQPRMTTPPQSMRSHRPHTHFNHAFACSPSVCGGKCFFLLWLFVCLAELLSHSITHRVWQYKSFIIEFKWHYIGSDFRCWFSVVWHVRKRDTHIDANGKHGVTYTRWYSACSRFGTFQVQFVLYIMWCVTHIFCPIYSSFFVCTCAHDTLATVSRNQYPALNYKWANIYYIEKTCEIYINRFT